MRRTLASLALLTGIACGSSRSADHANDAAPPSDDVPASPPAGSMPAPAPRDFPLVTPSLGGFSLAAAFPDAKINLPSAIVWPKAGGAGPFVLERTGSILSLGAGGAHQVLDISDAVALISESGALGMALHPMFGDGAGPKPYVYLWYNARGASANTQRLSRFTWSTTTQSFDRSSEAVLVEEAEKAAEHNGGRLQFGPDGFLYFGNGDDLDEANHQRLDRALFAGIFRIDVDSIGGAVSHAPPRQPEGGSTAGYFIPNDNPFVGVPGALEEYYALGLRNPFSFSFDRKTGALWAGDVGDTWRDEIDHVVAGGNYEWPYREGSIVRGTTPPTIGKSFSPIYEYSHGEMADLTAVIGGFVYRGAELPELAGKYVYSDWPSGRVWALDVASTPARRTTLIDHQWKRPPLALAEDEHGEIYVLQMDGISKLVRDASGAKVPKRLSETTLFENVASLEPEPQLVPYDVRSPLWSDGAVKRRWIRLPKGQRVAVGEKSVLSFPVGTVLVKQFDLPPSVVPHARTHRLETRVMVVGTETTYGLTYRWNAQGTDADLVLEPTDEGIQDDAGRQERTWHFPSFGQCWSCHRPENRILGFTAQQVDLAALAARGVFDPAAIVGLPKNLARPSDEAASLDERASAYLAANCSSCHHAGASYLGGGDTWNASPGVALADRGLVGAPHHNYPMARALGLASAPLIDPGNPAGSILLARVRTNEPDLRMPPLARNIVDDQGARLLETWIASLSP